MRQVQATLPALGTYAVVFYKESAELLDVFGSGELQRLNSIAHLGVAAAAFTGVNHTRLEYTLLQCAVISLLRKFNSDSSALAISSRVRLSGLKTRMSSGEELLKCWALLSNFGHMQYTYGVERALLMYAQQDEVFARQLVPNALPADIRNWCGQMIAEFRYVDFRWLLVLRRVCNQLPSRSRLKGRLIHIVRNLVLPLSHLFPTAPVDRQKMFRLRTVFANLRLLSMVTLDAYYSHHPIRYQLNSAIMDLNSLMKEPGQTSHFLNLLRQTAGYLADELFLHPTATAIQRGYEVRSLQKLSGHYARQLKSADGLSTLLRNARNTGFGKPQVSTFVPLFRISFRQIQRRLLGGQNEYRRLEYFESQLVNRSSTRVAVNYNGHTSTTHVDVVYTPAATIGDIGRVCSGTYDWLARALEAELVRQLRYVSRGGSDEEYRKKRVSRLLASRIRNSPELLRNVFEGVLSFLLPEGYYGSAPGYMSRPTQPQPFTVRLRLAKHGEVDEISTSLDYQLRKEPHVSADRRQELKAFKTVFDRTDAPFVVACSDKFVIRDRHHRAVDEWDGVFLAVSGGGTHLVVVEAKNRSSAARNEREA